MIKQLMLIMVHSKVVLPGLIHQHLLVLAGYQWTLDSGVCLPNSSMDIEFLFDATELDSGDYYGSIIINSSDPFYSICYHSYSFDSFNQ